ncbi:MAG TPA: pentapeptide repeat-containing protein [Rhizomicrobium sp.]|nr:pentapeptide repeat-containing protein [Rhizomicrobium sp.]
MELSFSNEPGRSNGAVMLKNLYGESRTARTQAELDAAVLLHERFATQRGGRRAQLGKSDLSGLRLANRNLAEADFSGASLVGASLFGAKLQRASLYCADLQRCDMRHADLTHADMRGVSLKGANLSFAKLDNADLRAAMMMYMGAEGIAIVDHGEAAGDGTVDFSNCSLKRASFGNAKLDGANFSGAMLQGANFRGAKLKNVKFEGAILTGVDLKDIGAPPEAFAGCITDVTPAALAKFDMLRSRLDAHQEWIVSAGKQGSHCVLDGEDIRMLQKLVVGRPLTGLSARGAVAVGLNFAGSQLQGARFDGADLRDADFTGADLRGASFADAKIGHAKFDKADLRSLVLGSGQVRAVHFEGALGSESQFAGALLDDGDVSQLGLIQRAA